MGRERKSLGSPDIKYNKIRKNIEETALLLATRITTHTHEISLKARLPIWLL